MCEEMDNPDDDLIDSQPSVPGCRKASTPVPFRPNPTDEEKAAIAFEDWQPIAPSAVIHSPTAPGFKEPREMTLDDIKRFKTSFVEAVLRAEKAGFDVVEIHSAHGYLLNQFLSPTDDRRGGTVRTSQLLEIGIPPRTAR